MRPSDNGKRLPERWQRQLEGLLQTDETVLASFETDLDRELNFAEGALVLTNHRLLAFEGPQPPSTASPATRQWRLDEISSLSARDRSGLGMMELHGPSGRLAFWRYTVARAPAAQSLALRLKSLAANEPIEPEAPDDADDEPPTTATTGVLLRLLKFAKPRAGLISLGFLLTMAATAMGLVPTYLTSPLTTLLTTADPTPENYRTVLWYLGLMAITAFLSWLLTWGQGVVMARAAERISADLRNYVYAHLQKLSLEYFGGKRTGDLIARISNDTERICYFLSDNMVDFSSDILLIIGTAIMLSNVNVYLALAAVVPLPLIIWMVYVVRERMRRGFHRGGRAWGDMTSILADTIPGIRVVKAFAQEPREVERFRTANNRIIEVNDRVNKVWTFFWPMVALLNQLGLLIVYLTGAWLVFGTSVRLDAGEWVLFIAALSRIYVRMESMSRMLSTTQRAAAGAQRLFEILDRVPSVPEPAHPVHPGEIRGEIELRHVTFRHGSRTILEDINLKIAPREMIGLVGPSGSGKSTLVNLVCRFYDVAEGAILVDGVDVRNFPVNEYRKHIGLVLQEPFLFYGTVADNIAYGKPNATRAEILEAAKAARAHEFILRLPLGYDSLVGERGQSLSGGERQRISIARALLIDPKILILDEATSSVDTETEREIQLALDNLVQGRTTIAIAHRLSTLRKADRLVVLERGKIVEIGQHQDLILQGGVYSRLHNAQQEQFIAE